jgi:hypothetical protein
MLHDFFVEGGVPMYATLLFGFLWTGCAALYSLRPEPRWTPLLVGLGLLTLTSGLSGFAFGLEISSRYLSHVAPTEQFLISRLGFAESLNNVILALVLAAIAALLISVGGLRSLRLAASAR